MMSIYRSYLSDHDDQERLEAKRQEIKRKIAEREIKQLRVNDLVAVLRDVEAELEHAQADRDKAVEPLEAELTAMDNKRIEAAINGKAYKDDAARRRELSQKIYEADRELEITRQANHESQRKINKEIDRLRMEISAGAALENDLSRLAPLDCQAEAKAISELSQLVARLLGGLKEKEEANASKMKDGKLRWIGHGKTALQLEADTIKHQSKKLSAFLDDLRQRERDLRSVMVS